MVTTASGESSDCRGCRPAGNPDTSIVIVHMLPNDRGGRGIDVAMSHLVAGISGRHVEIMRGALANILFEATRHGAVPIRGLDRHHRRRA